MKFYLAPMEAVTNYVFRKVYFSMMGDADKYFSPFIMPTQKKILKTRERKDIAPENNKGMYMVPQILTNQGEQFAETCTFLRESGYREVNLNIGCPAATVVTKKKGCGLLDVPDYLNRFLDEIFSWNDKQEKEDAFLISVKTRLGMYESREFFRILEIYNQYPLHELIIHPRVRQDFYNGKPDWEAFSYALENSKHPLCYNGDIFRIQDYNALRKRFPELQNIMLGRGLVANPALIRELKGGKRITKEELQRYHDALYEAYCQDMSGEKDVLFKMKEMWSYMGTCFTDSEKILKNIQKVRKPEEYRQVVREAWQMLGLVKQE